MKIPALILGSMALLLRAHAAVSPEEITTTAKWFDSLSWPDVRDKPYVDIKYLRGGVPAKTEDRPGLRGFLLAEDARELTLFPDGTFAWAGGEMGWPLVAQRHRKIRFEVPEAV